LSLRFSYGGFHASQRISVWALYFPKLFVHAKVDVRLSCRSIFWKNLE